MKSLGQKLLVLSMAVLVVLPLAAQDKQKKGKKKGGNEPGVVANIKKAMTTLELTEEQKKKVDDLIAQHTPKIREAAKAAGDAPARLQAARKKLSDEGKKGKELNSALKDSVKLTAEEQAAVDKLNAAGQDLREAVLAVLTDEQKAKSGLSGAKGKKKKKNS